MDALRNRATNIGIDLDNIENGVALPHKWHLNETTAAKYYERVLGIF